MSPSPRPSDDRALSSGEQQELRDTVVTFVPPVLIAFVLRWALIANAGWPPRRALLTSIGVGIVLALLVQRAMSRRARR